MPAAAECLAGQCQLRRRYCCHISPACLLYVSLSCLPAALQLVYCELRECLFERLYRFHVQVTRLELVLQVGAGVCFAWPSNRRSIRAWCPYCMPAFFLAHFAPVICRPLLKSLLLQLPLHYRPAPAPPIQEVDRLLGDICGRVHDALPPRLARAVCVALVAAVQSVLLDGGPYRWGGWVGGRHAWLLEHWTLCAAVPTAG